MKKYQTPSMKNDLILNKMWIRIKKSRFTKEIPMAHYEDEEIDLNIKKTLMTFLI